MSLRTHMPNITRQEVVTDPPSKAQAVSNSFTKTPLESSDGFLTRDIMWQEQWREREQDESKPAEVLPTVHYLWCGKELLRFHHYLGILSAIRVLHPTKIVIHYTHLPLTDHYNAWFQELKSSIMDLELKQITEEQCSSGAVLRTVLSFFSAYGGFFIGPGMILARPPSFQGNASTWYATTSKDSTKVIVAVKAGFNVSSLQTSMTSSMSSTSAASTKCVNMVSFRDDTPCVALETAMYPRDIVASKAAFAELARWLFYGRREPLEPKRFPANPMPRIAHVIKIKPFGSATAMYGSNELSFNHFLSIISALYVGGFERVYFHAEEPPSGRWWEELAKENVTLLPLDPPRSVFQQEIKVVHHVGDLVKYLVLNKYGGAYQDFDAIWASRVPDWLLEYPAVAGFEWTRQGNTGFPESLNMGLLMAQAGSAWLRQFIKSHHDFRDHMWGYNPILMPYRMFELYPETVFLDRHLQVMCFNPYGNPPSICHPSWEENYVRDIYDTTKPLQLTDWKTEVRAFHITGPKPHPSLASPKALAAGKGFIAGVGKYILEKSGRQNLLKAQ